ncbi:unnamed protein product [Rotaria magnacalcarata]|uniref:Uncharacterized protein n=1 Tax=Rotaria magnacalcarata TaxID=392030 RepID=A0A815YGB9_9BILA|nr:unnamed protein product [Rotaria magnacalcarata]CAF4406549.1 unnamed protein product [Rotaria magnacalcarata]CAF4813747.1 unnamed protein product [Rotaria magnacalcarata]
MTLDNDVAKLVSLTIFAEDESNRIGAYDAKIQQRSDELAAMFTFSELQLSIRRSREHLFRDAEFGLKESIKSMLLQVCRDRQHIRTYGGILFFYEGIFDYCNRPVLTVSYSDMNDIEETNVADMARLVRALSMIELHRQAEDISGARQNSILLHSDYNVFDMKASAEELDLMRKILKQNLKQTKGNHRHGLIGP